MLICTIAILLLALLGALGFFQGAIKLLVILAGLLLGAALAYPLAPTLSGLMPTIGVTNPVWQMLLPPIIVFSLIVIVSIVAAFLIHRKIELYYKYKTDDIQRLSWEKMNKGFGAFVGVVAGVACVFIFSTMVYFIGYLTAQVTTEDGGSGLARFFANARKDLREAGLDRGVAAFDPMPPKYYETADILGLIYHNPVLLGRLAQYPPFLTMGERSEIQDIASDTEYNNLLLSKGDFMEIVNNPKTQALLANKEIMQELLQQDLKDLRRFLETGVSPKFQDEKILGKWNLDFYSTLAQERKKRPDMSASELKRLKQIFTEIAPTISLMATTDKKLILKVSAPAAAPPANPDEQAADASGAYASPELAQRYGLNRPPAAARPNTPAPSAKPAGPVVTGGEGTWERLDDQYTVAFQSEQGQSAQFKAVAHDDELTLLTPQATLVFLRSE